MRQTVKDPDSYRGVRRSTLSKSESAIGTKNNNRKQKIQKHNSHIEHNR